MSEWLNLFSSGCAALTFRASVKEVIEESTASALGSETSSGHGAAMTFRICAVVGCQVSTHGLQTQPKTHALNCLESSIGHPVKTLSGVSRPSYKCILSS